MDFDPKALSSDFRGAGGTFIRNPDGTYKNKASTQAWPLHAYLVSYRFFRSQQTNEYAEEFLPSMGGAAGGGGTKNTIFVVDSSTKIRLKERFQHLRGGGGES